MNTPVKIITPFYNCQDFIYKSLITSLTQEYDNFKVIAINDASTDQSEEAIQPLIDNGNLIYIKNDTRMCALFNHQNAILNYCDPSDIVVQVDGDDWLSNPQVLTYINKMYQKHDCLLTYGQFEYLSGKMVDGRPGNSQPYVDRNEFLNKRKSRKFHASHLRTFKAFLFHEIKNQDPSLSCFKNKDNAWYNMTYDIAIMYPLMEICGYDRVHYNDKVLLVYNDSNPIQEFKVDIALQSRVHSEIIDQPEFRMVKYV